MTAPGRAALVNTGLTRPGVSADARCFEGYRAELSACSDHVTANE